MGSSPIVSTFFSGIGRSADGRGGAQADELIVERFAGKAAAQV